MENEKFILRNQAYFIDFRGKIKSGSIYSIDGEKIGVMGLGTTTMDAVWPSRQSALKDRMLDELKAKDTESKTFEIEFHPCHECKVEDAELCAAFCVIKTEDGRYFHPMFKKKRKKRENGQISITRERPAKDHDVGRGKHVDTPAKPTTRARRTKGTT